MHDIPRIYEQFPETAAGLGIGDGDAIGIGSPRSGVECRAYVTGANKQKV